MELLEGLFVIIATCAAFGVGLGLGLMAKIAIYVLEFKWGKDD